MHLLVPFAATASEAGRHALSTLSLPQLDRLLARLQLANRDEGEPTTLSPPHERALARALGWQGADGGLPFAARAAAADGIEVGDEAWGLVTPAHWHLGTEQVSLLDPVHLMLDETASRTLFGAVLELFTSEGFRMVWGAASRWYIAHPSLAALHTASLDRVIGRNVDRWLTGEPAVRLIRRLQNEVQMLLYNHPLNDERSARGLLPVNSFWLSGCGVAQSSGPAPTVDERLRSPALNEDWAAWAKAWQTLDEGPIARLLESPGPGIKLTLCGESAAATWSSDVQGGGPAWWRAWRAPKALPTLETL